MAKQPPSLKGDWLAILAPHTTLLGQLLPGLSGKEEMAASLEQAEAEDTSGEEVEAQVR